MGEGAEYSTNPVICKEGFQKFHRVCRTLRWCTVLLKPTKGFASLQLRDEICDNSMIHDRYNNMFLLVSHYPDFLITSCIHAFENYAWSIVLQSLSFKL